MNDSTINVLPISSGYLDVTEMAIINRDYYGITPIIVTSLRWKLSIKTTMTVLLFYYDVTEM